MKHCKYSEVPAEYRRDYKKLALSALAAFGLIVFTVVLFFIMFYLGMKMNTKVGYLF